jgi:hypothetical protein
VGSRYLIKYSNIVDPVWMAASKLKMYQEELNAFNTKRQYGSIQAAQGLEALAETCLFIK